MTIKKHASVCKLTRRSPNAVAREEEEEEEAEEEEEEAEAVEEAHHLNEMSRRASTRPRETPRYFIREVTLKTRVERGGVSRRSSRE